MKVLIYVPLAPITPKIYARSLTSIFAMQWHEPCEIVFGRNDGQGTPGNNGHYPDLTAKYNRGRQMTLDGGYDAMLTVESDMILPPLTLERLSRVDADVAYGLYVSRHGSHKWLAFDHITGAPYTGASLSDVPEEAVLAWGNVRETAGVGLGCTLIHRRVLEKISFRCPDIKVANDWIFSLDCKANGFIQAHDCGVVCGHIQGAPDPKIFWPDPTGKYSVQFFDEAMPESVRLSNKFDLTIHHLGTKELYRAPQEVS